MFSRSRIACVVKTGTRIALLTMVLTACKGNEAKELKPEQIAEYNKPGTVLVQANHKLEYSYPKPLFDRTKQKPLMRALQQKVAKGEVDASDAFAYFIREMLSNPLKYVSTGEKIEGRAEVPTTGTGFIVSPDGTIATAAHVVSNKGKTIKRELAKTALSQVTRAYCQQQMDSLSAEDKASLNGKISPKQFMTLCFDGFLSYYLKNLSIDQVQTEAAVLLQPTNPQQGTLKPLASEIKKMGESPAEDVAILKIEGNHLPTLALSDRAVATGNEVFSLGYPGAVTGLIGKRDKQSTALTQLPEPTLTTGGVSAAQQSVAGGTVIQANVAISPGNSGGALFDKQGQVIGIASFVSVNNKGEQVQGASFFVPVGVLKRQLQEVGVTPQSNPLMDRYQEAIEQFNQQQYGKALQRFKEIRDTNAEFPYVQQYISKAQAESAGETLAIPLWVSIPAGIAIVGIGTFLGLKVKTKLRDRTANSETSKTLTTIEK